MSVSSCRSVSVASKSIGDPDRPRTHDCLLRDSLNPMNIWRRSQPSHEGTGSESRPELATCRSKCGASPANDIPTKGVLEALIASTSMRKPFSLSSADQAQRGIERSFDAGSSSGLDITGHRLGISSTGIMSSPCQEIRMGKQVVSLSPLHPPCSDHMILISVSNPHDSRDALPSPPLPRRLPTQ